MSLTGGLLEYKGKSYSNIMAGN